MQAGDCANIASKPEIIVLCSDMRGVMLIIPFNSLVKSIIQINTHYLKPFQLRGNEKVTGKIFRSLKDAKLAITEFSRNTVSKRDVRLLEVSLRDLQVCI